MKLKQIVALQEIDLTYNLNISYLKHQVLVSFCGNMVQDINNNLSILL
jgi:hypothetical protein